MKNYKNKVYLFLYVSLVIVLGSFAILFTNFRKQVKLQNKILVIENNLIQADSLINNLLQLESAKRGFQLTGDVTYLRDFYRIKTGCLQNLSALKKNAVHQNDLVNITRIDGLVKTRLSSLDSGITLFRNEGTAAAVAFMQQPGKRDLLNRVSLDLAALKNTFQDHLRGITIDINEKGNRNVAGLFLLLFVFVALMLVAAKTFRKAQKKMILNHLKFKQAQQIGKIGSWEWNFQTGHLKWSREQYRIFGVDPKLFQPSYDQYLLFLDPIEQHRTKRLINDTIDGIAEFSLEHQITRADGSCLFVFEQGTILFDEKTGKPSGMFGITQDISDRKRDAEALQQARRKFEDIVDHAADGIYQSTPEGKFIMVNPSMAAIFGYDSPEQMMMMVTNIGEQLYAVAEERETMSELIRLYGHVEDYEIQVVTRNRETIWVSANIRYVEVDNTGYFEGTLENITRRKADEQEILQLNQNLDQFANITAHDLQEPIRMVSGFLGLFDKKYGHQIDEQGKSYILRAKDGADRMSILIRDLLEYSRSGNKSANYEPVDLNHVLDLVHQDMEIVMDKADAALYISNSMPVVEGAQSALYRLFLNLVSNGIKFCRKDCPPEVTVMVEESGDHWLFSVRDNGIGVAENDQHKLFNAFQRLHRREEYPGTGLGLVTCKKIVEMHGGKIWMESIPGLGTTFYFTLKKAAELIKPVKMDLIRA